MSASLGIMRQPACMPTPINATSGSAGIVNATASVALTTTAIDATGSANQRTSTTARPIPNVAVNSHLYSNTMDHTVDAVPGSDQFAKTRMPTSEAKYVTSCPSVRAAATTGAAGMALVRACSSARKRPCMIRPMTTLNTMAPIARATPSRQPSTRAVRTMASRLIAGPE